MPRMCFVKIQASDGHTNFNVSIDVRGRWAVEKLGILGPRLTLNNSVINQVTLSNQVENALGNFEYEGGWE